jgi:class 3 adenylate cyclase/streptogramin lyase
MAHTSAVRAPSDRRLAAILFLDVVGSTTIAAEAGDRRWRELLTRFRRTVRTELRRGGGHEEDTAGDGFFATFAEPARAVRTADAIASAVHEHGLEVRCGIHFGECEVVDGRLAGIAVHIGARVMSMAGPAEVLVTGTVRDLATGAGIGFEDRGTHELKGVPGSWPLFAVRTIDDRPAAEPLAADEAESRRRTAPARGMLGRRAPSLMGTGALIGLGAVVAVAPVVTIVAATRDGGDARGPDASPTGGDSTSPTSSAAPELLHEAIVRLDPENGAITEQVDGILEGGLGPGRTIVFAEGSVWVMGEGTALARIEGGTVARVRDAAGGDVAAGDRQIWIGTSTGVAPDYHVAVSRIDVSRNSATRPIALPGTFQNALSEIAVGDRYVWSAYAGGLARIDNESGAFDVRDTGGDEDGVEAFGSTVWVTDVLNNVLMRIDPDTIDVVRSVELDSNADALAIGGAGTWFVDSSAGFAQEIEDEGLGEQVQVGTDPLAIAVGSDYIWVANRADGTISRIDADTHLVETFPVPGSPIALAVEPQSGAVWVYLI